MSTEIEALKKLYSERDIAEKHLSFEQWEKLWSLRQKKDVELKSKHQPSNRWSNYKPHVFEVDERCIIRVKVNDKFKQIGGIIRKINKDGTCDVSTGFKFYKNVRPGMRTRQDMSKVEIPEFLKKLSTKRLLSLLQSTARSHYFRDYWDDIDGEYQTCDRDLYISGNHVTRMQIKAELYNREHVLRKDERRDILNSNREESSYKKKRRKNKRFSY